MRVENCFSKLIVLSHSFALARPACVLIHCWVGLAWIGLDIYICIYLLCGTTLMVFSGGLAHQLPPPHRIFLFGIDPSEFRVTVISRTSVPLLLFLHLAFATSS